MKITRLKKGYRIRLSDSEFDALQLLAGYGEGAVMSMDDHEWRDFSTAEKRGIPKIIGRGSWAVEDRRL